MSVSERIAQLADYGVRRGLIGEADRVWAVNSMLDALGLTDYAPPEHPLPEAALEEILRDILDDAVVRGLIEDGTHSRDMLDTRLMGIITPRPSQVAERFSALRAADPRSATDWFYRLSTDTDYIRSARVARDLKWTVETEYGTLDITINLSKPEKDPRAIAAAGRQRASGYPKCLLCREAEGYAGRADYPARQNHRLVPLTLGGAQWFMQYSPYVYYNEHCIVLNEKHIPMRIDRGALSRLLEFTELFPHYFIGSNADLPIVGGSILSHDHFQGGRYEFAMERAETETALCFRGFGDVEAGILRWPMSALRLRCGDRARLTELADRILTAWRAYSDPAAGIYAKTLGEPHNTVTPIARRRGGDFELDMVLRNNLCTDEYPLGVFHPHGELHHIKKENIGLIEVMGLAILPARLRDELAKLAELLYAGGDLYADGGVAKHAAWAEELRSRYVFTPENAMEILQREVGLVFKTVLEHSGVFKRDDRGREAFMRFTESI